MKMVHGMITLLLVAGLSFSMGIGAEPKQTDSKKEVAQATPQKTVKLLAISGSARSDSCNQKALKLLAKASMGPNISVTLIDMADFSMPLYDGDLETKQGMPENAKRLQALISQHDGFLVASPEYNGLPTPLLKNIFDWVSRPVKDNPQSGLKIFEGKVAALISASPGPWGGMRGLPISAQLLSNLGLIVMPERVTIGNCFASFDDKGDLNDEKLMEYIKNEGKAVARLARALKNVDNN